MPGKRQDPVYQAQAILSRRDHSLAEVSRKLRAKGFGKDEIAKTIAWLQEKNLVDDRRFAQAYVESILRSKPVGPRYLSAKLKQKGVGDSIIEETIKVAFQNPPQPSLVREGADSPPDKGEREGVSRESQLIEEAITQWRRTHPSTRSGQVPKHAEDKQRLYRFLVSRGFSSDMISSNLTPSTF